MPLLRLSTEIRDRLRYSPSVRHAMARWLLRRVPSDSGDTDSISRSIIHLCRATRQAQTEPLMVRIEQEIEKRVRLIGDRKVNWSQLTGDWKAGQMEKAVVLKPYVGPRERGVVLVSFEYQWARMMGITNLKEFAQRYLLVQAPTWSPPHNLANTLFPAQYPHRRIVTLISNAQDVKIFPRLSSKYQVVPLYASSWVNPALYQAVDFESKDIDIVMVANFSQYKRHFALFRALRDLPPNLRVVLVGQASGGRTRAMLLREAALYGVAERLEIRESVPDEVVVDTLARSKISLILSMQEGSCVAVVEAMFANTPVGVLEDAVVGSKSFVNEHTGRLLRHRDLGSQLADFLANAHRYSPRKWALDHGWDCHGSTAILNQALKEKALAEGEEWTQDLAVHHWRPDPILVDPQDQARMASSYQDIRERYRMSLGK